LAIYSQYLNPDLVKLTVSFSPRLSSRIFSATNFDFALQIAKEFANLLKQPLFNPILIGVGELAHELLHTCIYQFY